MKPRPPLPGGPYLVLGLARSGAAAALALRARGEAVVGVDSGRPQAAGRLLGAGVEVHMDAVGTEHVARARTLVKSPGVPSDAPAVLAARERGLAVIGELELAWRLLPNEFVAVTGTNGKTTTTELLGAIHREAGVPHAVAGNVGTAVSSLAGSLAPEAVVVCECSSFQLEDTEAFAPEAAVLLNIAPDHLDRHGTLEAYTQAKLQAFARQGNDDIAVAPDDLGVDDLGGCAKQVLFGETPAAVLSDRAGHLFWQDEPLIAHERIRLRGPHNRRNAMAAAAVSLARGIGRDPVVAALENFAGVPHRLEEVLERDGVLYVNDSKATNVASALVALQSFPGGVRLIAGGRPKGEPFTPLAGAVSERAVGAYLIGEAAAEIAEALAGTGVPVHECGDLERAVAQARAEARPGEVVLLAPAATSFDQFTDFEARGEAFRALVEAP